MKVLDLQCAQGHRFEGWFGSEAECQAQLASEAIACPLCGGSGWKEVAQTDAAGRACVRFVWVGGDAFAFALMHASAPPGAAGGGWVAGCEHRGVVEGNPLRADRRRAGCAWSDIAAVAWPTRSRAK